MELLRSTLGQVHVIDLLALAWLLIGVALGLVRGLGPLFAWLLWILGGLWLSRTIAPVLLGWLSNTEGADGPDAVMAAYGSLCALTLGLPLLGRGLSGPGGAKRPTPSPGDRGLAVIAGAACALLTLVLLLPYAGRWQPLGRSYPDAVSPRVGASVQELLWWLYPRAHAAELEAWRTPRVDDDRAGGPPEMEPMAR